MQKREKRLCGGETHSRFLPASVGGPTLPGPKRPLTSRRAIVGAWSFGSGNSKRKDVTP